MLVKRLAPEPIQVQGSKLISLPLIVLQCNSNKTFVMAVSHQGKYVKVGWHFTLQTPSPLQKWYALKKLGK